MSAPAIFTSGPAPAAPAARPTLVRSVVKAVRHWYDLHDGNDPQVVDEYTYWDGTSTFHTEVSVRATVEEALADLRAASGRTA